jgi:hypothetical protein
MRRGHPLMCVDRRCSHEHENQQNPNKVCQTSIAGRHDLLSRLLVKAICVPRIDGGAQMLSAGAHRLLKGVATG